MGEAKHTPGPWAVGGDGPWICTVGNNHNDPAIFGPRPADGEPFPFGEKTADARLIAAAPDMLEALREAQAALSDGAFEGPHVDAALRSINSAIAKAEGRS